MDERIVRRIPFDPDSPMGQYVQAILPPKGDGSLNDDQPIYYIVEETTFPEGVTMTYPRIVAIFSCRLSDTGAIYEQVVRRLASEGHFVQPKIYLQRGDDWLKLPAHEWTGSV